MTIPLQVLILTDQPDEAELIARELYRAGFDIDWRRIESEQDYLAALSTPIDLILSEYVLPAFDALHALQLLQERELDIPFIVVSGASGQVVAVECNKQG